MGERQVDLALLIELIQQEPHIFDKANKMFKDDRVKQGTYDKIGRVLNITGEQCRRIWKNLRDRYVREKRKTRVTHSGQEYEDSSLWPYLKHTSFLEPYIKPRRTYTATHASTSSTIISPSPFIIMETESDGTSVFEELNEDLQEPEDSQEPEELHEPEESQASHESMISPAENSTPTFLGETPNNTRPKRNNNVANELVDAARQIVAQIKPARTSTTNSFFRQYVAKRLQEMAPEERSAKRRAIVLLLEN